MKRILIYITYVSILLSNTVYSDVIMVSDSRHIIAINDNCEIDTILISDGAIEQFQHMENETYYYLQDKRLFQLDVENSAVHPVLCDQDLELFVVNELGDVVITYFNEKWDNIIELIPASGNTYIVKKIPMGEWVVNLQFKGNTLIYEVSDESHIHTSYIFNTLTKIETQIELDDLYNVKLVDQKRFIGGIYHPPPLRIIFSNISPLDQYIIAVDIYRDRIPLFSSNGLFGEEMDFYFLGYDVIPDSIPYGRKYDEVLMNSFEGDMFLYRINVSEKRIEKLLSGNFHHLCLIENKKIYYISNEKMSFNKLICDLNMLDLESYQITRLLTGVEYDILSNNMYYIE